MPDPFNGRIHHFFSDLEKNFFYYLCWNKNVIDIREQFPLDSRETEKIAESLGYRHPVNQDGSSYVMTTDFLVSYKDPKTDEELLFARCVKRADEIGAAKKRMVEKLQIEYEYWRNKGIDWKVVTEMSFSKEESHNAEEFLKRYNDFSPGEFESVKENLLHLLLEGDKRRTIADICRALDSSYHLSTGKSLGLFYYMVSHREVAVYIDSPFSPSKKVEEVVDMDTMQRAQERRAERHELTN